MGGSDGGSLFEGSFKNLPGEAMENSRKSALAWPIKPGTFHVLQNINCEIVTFNTLPV